MFELFTEMNWSLIATLIAVSAVVAWAGDIIGMKLGKKRITFLSLRPKYTSRIISVLTGVGIALATLFVISVASEPVRTALFSMKFVQNQITTLTAELNQNRDSLQSMTVDLFESRGDLQEKQDELSNVERKLAEGTKNLEDARRQLADMKAVKEKTELEQAALLEEKAQLLAESRRLEESVTELKSEAENLKAGIQRLREGRIAALTGEILAQGVINESEGTAKDVDQALERFSDESRALLAYRFGKKPEDIREPIVNNESVSAVKREIVTKPGRYLLRLTALTNAVEGEPVMAELEVFHTRLIYKAEEILEERRFAAGTSREKTEEQVFRALRNVNARAAQDGVLRDPLSGNVGSIDTAEFMDAIDAITESHTDKILQIVIKDDVYTEGPVRVRFIIK